MMWTLNLEGLGSSNFGGGTPKISDPILKLQSPLNMWQSLVMISPEISEIRQQIKLIKRIESATPKHKACAAGCYCRAAYLVCVYFWMTLMSKGHTESQLLVCLFFLASLLWNCSELKIYKLSCLMFPVWDVIVGGIYLVFVAAVFWLVCEQFVHVLHQLLVYKIILRMVL